MSEATSHTSDMGGAVSAAVEAVVSDGVEAVSVADAGSKEAFLDAWTRTLVEHARLLRAKGEQLAAPAVFIYVPNWAKLGKELGWLRKPMLGSRASDPLAGFFGVGTLEVGAFVRPGQITDTHETTEAIEQAGLGDYLTVALMSASLLLIWPHGVNADTELHRRELDDAKVVMDLELLDRNLSAFYEEVARQTKAWWLDPTRRIAVANTESVVQEALWHFLLGAYAERAKVRQEINSGSGRMDIVLRPLSMLDSSAVLELKVTKDFATPRATTTTPTQRSLKENINWAISGVAQTAGYRDHESLKGAFLCVYDFCAGNRKEIEDAIQTAASPHYVRGRRYWITASNEEHRNDRYPLPIASATTAATTATTAVTSTTSGPRSTTKFDNAFS